MINSITGVTERFLRYVSVDTQSLDEQEQIPSTEKQLKLAAILKEELEDMGVSGVRMDEHGYVYGYIPANTDKKIPAVGFISHIDTAPAAPGANIKAKIVKNYDGKAILLNEQTGQTLDPVQYPELLDYVGQDLITTDGTTLLGADDKAGVAEIMTMAACILEHPELVHGKICIAFTPDEEVGRGADLFDVEGFGADVAYTVDGGALGEIEYENFNAAGAKITIHGVSIHPGSARGAMKNSLLIGMELQSLLPVYANPACTDGYEGFFHLDEMKGDVEETVMKYIIRDHDRAKFEEKKALMKEAAAYLNRKYGEGTVDAVITDSYYNMKEKMEPHMELIEIASKALKLVGAEPKICPIRGGTDGARLSFMGLPCPNLCAGGHNFHGRYEYVPVQSMEKITEMLLRVVEQFVTAK